MECFKEHQACMPVFQGFRICNTMLSSKLSLECLRQIAIGCTTMCKLLRVVCSRGCVESLSIGVSSENKFGFGKKACEHRAVSESNRQINVDHRPGKNGSGRVSSSDPYLNMLHANLLGCMIVCKCFQHVKGIAIVVC